jgi:hypothetical protein
MHLLGLDHTQLTYRFSGRDFRLTDVEGEVVDAILALRHAASFFAFVMPLAPGRVGQLGIYPIRLRGLFPVISPADFREDLARDQFTGNGMTNASDKPAAATQ